MLRLTHKIVVVVVVVVNFMLGLGYEITQPVTLSLSTFKIQDNHYMPNNYMHSEMLMKYS